MTVREIARQAGVSAATVSRYFTGTEKVSEDVRCKIQSVLGDDVSSGKRSRHYGQPCKVGRASQIFHLLGK